MRVTARREAFALLVLLGLMTAIETPRGCVGLPESTDAAAASAAAAARQRAEAKEYTEAFESVLKELKQRVSLAFGEEASKQALEELRNSLQKLEEGSEGVGDAEVASRLREAAGALNAERVKQWAGMLKELRGSEAFQRREVEQGTGRL